MQVEKIHDARGKSVHIGILLNNHHVLHYFRPGRQRLEMLNEANKQLPATLFAFSLRDIDYGKNTVKGIYFDEGLQRWTYGIFPFPDVLYFRDGAPEHRLGEVKSFLKAVAANKTRMVNSLDAFNKWHLYQVLSKNSELKRHLPATVLCRNLAADFPPMLRKFGRVYLKACRGRQGRQVMQVTRRFDGLYEYRYFNGKLVMHRVSLNLLYLAISDFFRGREFIIQQPIDLLELEGRKVDLRAEVQRNGAGELEVVAVPVRIGHRNSPITTHASSFRFEDFFAGIMSYDTFSVEALKKRIDNLLGAIYQAVERHYGPFGEMGIDLGLDKKGKLWIIECNAQPAKVSLMKAYTGDTLKRAFTNPIQYALYIAGRS